ncbi:DUF6263 family protein [Danxiaibacter flavus]|uniref:DUF6263 family protein n=1 Tax=Danxiaibacter flavus TaxID=3049108 RepID=A0ABV3ZH67_9BACT|nr:DUF6263 family protein [Chitinophagaceae bacterium DXS]
MTKITSYLSVLFSVLLLISCKNGSYDLKFNPPAGAKYKYVVVMNQEMQQSMKGQEHNVDNTTEMYVTYEILQNTGADKHLKLTYNRFKGSSNGTAYDTDDSSAANGNNPMTFVYNGMKNYPLLITISEKGQVKDVTGIDELLDRVVGSIPLDSARKAMIRTTTEKIMGKDFVKSMIEQSFKIFPSSKVSVGDTWKDSMMLTAGLDFKMANSFTLKGVDNNKATIDVSSDITSGAMDMGMMKIETNMKGTQKGTTELDLPTGMTTSSDLDQQIEGNMKIMGMEIPVKIKTKIKVTGTKI